MKKTLLSAAAFAVAGVSAVAIMPTTSEAIPAFARQTGAACLSCHFQTFPALNSFGRSFKLNAFTDVGEQALVEDEGLSLPSVLNASMVLRAQYMVTKATGVASTKTWNVPGDAVLLLAGRVTPITGAFVEFAGNGQGATGGGAAANWQLMNSVDMDGIKVGLNIANTGFGPTAALETSSVYGQHAGKLNGGAVSAVNGITRVGNSTAVALWTGNDSFTVQAAGVAFADATAVTNASFVPMLRGTYVADLGGAELLLGGAILSGTQYANTVPAGVGVDAKWADFQIQGEMGDASYGVYGDFIATKAKAANGGLATNFFAGTPAIGAAAAVANGANAKRDGYGIRAEVKPTHHLMFGLGFKSDKTTPNGVTGTANPIVKVSTTQVAATYEIFQNMEINSYYQSASTAQTGIASTTTKTYFMEVEALM